MPFARTIDGDINPSQLGTVNAHEHLIRMGGGEILHDGEDMRLDDTDKAVEEATSYVVGSKNFLSMGGTIVDLCPIDCGRSITHLLEISSRVADLHIIVTTGFQKSHLYADEATHWLSRYSVDQITELLIADIEEGVDEHDYSGPIVKRSSGKAGVIKVATGYGVISKLEHKIIEAAAAASVQTGCPINTHTQHGTCAVEQCDLLIGYGVNPAKIAIGHVQRNPDVYALSEITERGCYVMFDGTYRLKYLPDSSREMLVRELTAGGYGKQILMGTDSGKKSYQKAYGAVAGVDYDMTVFGPRLRKQGFDEQIVQDIYINNGREFFTFDKS